MKKSNLLNTRKDGWIPQTNRFVGYIDIMGFKEYLTRTDYSKTYDAMFNALHTTKEFVSRMRHENTSYSILKITSYSDSIIIFTIDESKESLLSIIIAMSAMSESLLQEGFPFRGALTHGNMTLDIDNSIFFGRPLVDAYLLQEELLLYAIAIDGSAERILEDVEDIEERDFLITPYNCQFKNGSSIHRLIYPIGLPMEKGKETCESLRKLKFGTSGNLRKYIDNTRAFYENVLNVQLGLNDTLM